MRAEPNPGAPTPPVSVQDGNTLGPSRRARSWPGVACRKKSMTVTQLAQAIWHGTETNIAGEGHITVHVCDGGLPAVALLSRAGSTQRLTRWL